MRGPKDTASRTNRKLVRPGSEIYSRIIEVLEKLGGKAMESNLLEELRKRGFDVSLPELRNMLMKLEIRDKVRVLSLDEERRVVELLVRLRGPEKA
jgi:Fe2+ or Zn2+ uptake regulation protein